MASAEQEGEIASEAWFVAERETQRTVTTGDPQLGRRGNEQ
jgi:hypothetical protein